jgi:hypothetical protein
MCDCSLFGRTCLCMYPRVSGFGVCVARAVLQRSGGKRATQAKGRQEQRQKRFGDQTEQNRPRSKTTKQQGGDRGVGRKGKT